MTWYDRIPKVELHVHFEGSVPHDTLFDLIQKYGGDPSIPDVSALSKRFEYKDFPEFINTWSWKNQFLREYEDFTYVAEVVAGKMADQNIRYAELFYSPSIFERHHSLNVQELTEAIRRGLSKVHDVQIALVADLVRDYGQESETATLKQLYEVKNLGVIGIGIGGSEHEYPSKPFESLYRQARRMGFRTNAHAGEASGADSIWSVIEHLQVERIGHATRAREDRGLMDYIAEHQIPLELCPMSNVRTGVVNSLAEHPIREFFDKGMIISVNTDDPEMFNTSLADEYRMLENECGFSRQEIRSLIRLSLQSSWLPEDSKKSLAASFEKEPAWVE
jgi:adenosine deaminase